MDQMNVYAKFMKELLTGKRQMRNDENIVLDEDCSVIIHRKFPLKLIDPGKLFIPCSIEPLTVNQALCGLGTSTNLTLL